jgi:hypothetical protein
MEIMNPHFCLAVMQIIAIDVFSGSDNASKNPRRFVIYETGRD